MKKLFLYLFAFILGLLFGVIFIYFVYYFIFFDNSIMLSSPTHRSILLWSSITCGCAAMLIFNLNYNPKQGGGK